MTKIRKINVSQVEGSDANNTDANELRPFGETAFYLDTQDDTNKLVLMMFDGIRTHQKSKILSPGILYGSNADSGDGAGLDTIKLIPDATLHYNFGDYNNHQHLIIDPTAPNHIHIRAGGPIDNSNADLFLGGELTHVKVSDNQDNVVIRTSIVGEGITSTDWVFGYDGALTLPSGSPILFGNGNSRIQAGQGFHINSEEGISLEAVDITDPSNPVSYGWYFDTNGNLTLPAAGDILDSNGASVLGGGSTTATRVSITDDNLVLELNDPNDASIVIRSTVLNSNSVEVASTELGRTNGFVIRTNVTDDAKQWQFGNDGGLTFPDATVQTTSYTGTGAITFTGNEIQGNTFGGTGIIITKTVDSNGNDYSTGSGSLGFLNFGADGTIQNVKAGWIATFASGETRTVSVDAYQPIGTYWNISFDSAYSWGPGDVMPVTFSSPDYAAGTAPQVTLTAGTESWTFSENGTITLPDGMTIETAYGGGPTLVVDGKTHTVELRSDNTILIGYNDSSGNVYIGNPEGVGQVDIVGPKFRVFAVAPTASTGGAGDQAGQIAFNGSYIYYCTADYSDGLSNIWKRVAWSGDTW